MGFFDFLRDSDIHQGLEAYDAAPEGILLDVRTAQEYSEGHIPCSENVPLQHIERIRNVVSRKDTPIFVYCYSGARSRKAAFALREMGYTSVRNIGGICSYRGEMEHGEKERACWCDAYCSMGDG